MIPVASSINFGSLYTPAKEHYRHTTFGSCLSFLEKPFLLYYRSRWRTYGTRDTKMADRRDEEIITPYILVRGKKAAFPCILTSSQSVVAASQLERKSWRNFSSVQISLTWWLTFHVSILIAAVLQRLSKNT